MKVIQQANCNNSPKNQTAADMTYSILTYDKDNVNARFETGFDSLNLPDLSEVDEVVIVTAVSHGKSATSLSVYMKDDVSHYVGMFFEFTTHKAEAFKEIIVTEG